MLGPGVWPIGARYFGRKRINFRVLSDRLVHRVCLQVLVEPPRTAIATKRKHGWSIWVFGLRDDCDCDAHPWQRHDG
jgi:hypothetical protein